MRKITKLIAVVAVLVMAISVLAGCGGSKESAKDIIAKSTAASEEVQSMKGSYDIEFDLTMEAMGMELDMVESVKMDFESTTDPQASHVVMKMDIETMGQKQSVTAESYGISDNGTFTIFTNSDNTGWVSNQATTDEQLDQVKSLANDILAGSDVKVKGSEKVNGIDCYILTTTLKGNDIDKVMGQLTDSNPAFSGIDLSSIAMPCEVAVGKDDYLTYKVTIDMEEAIKTLFAEALAAQAGVDIEINLNHSKVELVVDSYNTVGEITLPPAALAR